MQSQVARDSWSTPQALGVEPESPRTSGWHARPWSLAQVSFETLSTPRALRTGPESPKISGPQRDPWNPSASRRGLLVDPSGTQTQARVTRESWSTLGASVQARVPWDSCSTPWHLTRSRVSRDACRNRGPLGMGLSRLKGWSIPWTIRLGPKSPVMWVDTADIRTLARVSRESWSNPRAFGPRPEWPVTTGRHRGHSELGRSRPGHLVDPA